MGLSNRGLPKRSVSRAVTGCLTFLAGAILAGPASAQQQKTVTIATVNNADMITMQKLSHRFEQQNPDIALNWVVLDENLLRQRVTTDIATRGGQFDVLTIGTYEAPIWGRQGWLVPMDELPADYDLDDVLKPVRDGLSADGKLYALPFYAESSMTYYRKDLFDKAGLKMPDRPGWDEIAGFAGKIHDPQHGTYGICLRGKPGWGENMALIGTMANSFGGRWFDEAWNPTIDTPEWRNAVSFYVDLLHRYGPPDAVSNGYNENRTLFADGKCGLWVDATSAAGSLFNPSGSTVADKVGFAQAPVAVTPKGSHWLWSWALAVPASSDMKAEAKKFVAWATSKAYIELVAQEDGWTVVPPGTRLSTYQRPEYLRAAPFAGFVLKSIQDADPNDATLKPVPYTGIQFVGIQVGQTIAAALAGSTTVDQALAMAQAGVERVIRQAGYHARN